MRRKSGKKSLSHTRRDVRHRRTKANLSAEKKNISAGKDKRSAVKKPPPVAISGWRLWLFRIVAVCVIPVLLLLLAEVGLRVAGYGFDAAVAVKCQVNGRASYCNNVKFGWRFFPRNISRVADQFVFAADKPDETYRIFVLGASAAQGTPDGAFCFGRVLQAMLRDAYPGVDIEVVTAAMPAINSHAVLEIAKNCVRYQPDLFVVYLGNNEVVGPYGPGTVFSPFTASLSLIRAGISLKATRVGQLLAGLFELAGSGKNIPTIWRGTEMFLEKQVRADDGRLETVYSHFQRNLEDIRYVANKSGTKVIFCTVASNLKDSPPFSSLHRVGLTDAEEKNWEEI